MVNKPLIIKYWKSTDSAELRSTSLCLECLVDFGLPQTCSDIQCLKQLRIFIWLSDRDFMSQPKVHFNNQQKNM
jgi:hypothetical protein